MQVEAISGVAKLFFNTSYRFILAAIEGAWLGAWGRERFLWCVLLFKIHM